MQTPGPYLLGLLGLALSAVAAAHPSQDDTWSGWPALPTPAWQQALDFVLSPAAAAATVSIDGDYRSIKSDGLPNHGTGQFPNSYNPNQLRAQRKTYRVPVAPVYREQTVALGLWPFGVAVNGIPFDPGAAEFWRRDRRSGWQYEAMAGAVDLGLDRNHAHVQRDGSYHYHGRPDGLLEQFDTIDPPILVGWAADGFPIYGPRGYRKAGDPASGLTTLRSSYRLRNGSRPGGESESSRRDGPGGPFDGSFVQDYEYQAEHGDLDDCNGRFGITAEYPDGSYHYVITDTFPFIPRCFHGQPDRSFLRGPGGNSGQRGYRRGERHRSRQNGRQSGRHGGNQFGGPDAGGAGLAGPSRRDGRRDGGRDGHRGGRRGPPPEAIEACAGRRDGEAASFVSPFGDTVTEVCCELRGPLFLLPDHHRPPR